MTTAHIPCPECGSEGHLLQGHDVQTCPACFGNGWVEVEVRHPPKTRTAEVNEILGWFGNLLEGVLGDGAKKRAAGLKVYWKIDPGHYAAQDRHRIRHDAGERYDNDSGCHHKIHEAARCLMIAYQEMVEDGLIPAD